MSECCEPQENFHTSKIIAKTNTQTNIIFRRRLEKEASREKVKQKIKSICSGLKFTIALTDHGDVYSWGSNNTGFGESYGETQVRVPTPVTTDDKNYVNVNVNVNGVKKINNHQFNQLGSRRAMGDEAPHEIVGLKLKRKHHAGIVSISAGARHAIASNVNGQVLTWGWNEFGMLGTGDCYPLEGVHEVLGELENKCVKEVSAGWRHSAVLTEGGGFTFGGRRV